MNCPSCGSPDYYEMVLKDCANPSCIYFNNGTATTTTKSTSAQRDLDFRGFVVLREGREMPTEEYVFATRADAERWRELNGLGTALIRPVRAVNPFKWQPSRGTVRGIILADRLYDIHEEVPTRSRPNFAVLER